MPWLKTLMSWWARERFWDHGLRRYWMERGVCASYKVDRSVPVSWRLRIEVPEGDPFPKFHGFCYRKLKIKEDKRYAVTFLVPINIVVWVARQVWAWLRFPPTGISDKKYQKAYCEGYGDGLTQWKKNKERVDTEVE